MREEYLNLYEQIRTLIEEDREAALALAEQTSHQAAAADLRTLAAFFNGMILRLQGEYSDAATIFESCLQDNDFPLPGELLFELGRAQDFQQHYDAAIQYYQQALGEETFNTPGDAWDNMGYAYHQKGHYDRVIECLLQALAEESYDTPGDAWNNMGYAYDEKGDYDRAIECYEKALAEETFDRRADAWSNMGSAYHHKGDYDRAIECHEKALAEETYDTPGAALYNMGNAYAQKSHYDRAIEYYERAVDEDTFDTPGRAWNNMGIAYRHEGDYDRAIECYKRALAELTFDSPGKAWGNMGTAYLHLRKTDEARQNYQRAIEEFEKSGAYTDAELVRSVLRSINAGQDADATALSDLLTALERPRVDDLKADLAAKWQRTRNIVEDWALRGKDSELDDVMVFLKGWSSSIPWIAAAQVPVPPPIHEKQDEDDQPDTAMPLAEITPAQRSHFQQQLVRRGGYFLKWNGRGTVIDPGVSFVTNFLAQGFNAKEIHHVLTTHHHIDHAADLVPVQNIVKEYSDASGQPHPLLHYWDIITWKSRDEVMKDAGAEPDHWDLRSAIEAPSAALRVEAVGSRHCKDSVALRLDLTSPSGDKTFSTGLSSDAGPEAADDLSKLFQDCQLIVLHFSKTNELDLLQHQHIEGHLGYTGCKQIIEATDAELYVLAEFSGERGDYRFEVTRILAEETGRRDRIIPADIGLTVCLPGERHDFLGVRCSQCGKFCRVSQINILQPPYPFGPLTYFCPDCMM